MVSRNIPIHKYTYGNKYTIGKKPYISKNLPFFPLESLIDF